MAYTTNVPTANQLISQSQPIINANFAALESFGNGYAEISIQVSAPSFTAGNDGLYVLNNATTTKNEMYIHKQTQAGTTAIPFTASVMSNVATASCINGWSYLPSGLLMKWGTTAAAATPVAITPTVTGGGPNFTKVFTVYVTGYDTALATFTCGQATAANDTSGNFTAYCANPSATTSIKWLVLGV